MRVSIEKPIIAWWSGGVTSAVACKLCIDWFGLDFVRLVFIDTKNEDPDTYRFKDECENWYGKQIETITRHEYGSIQEVWYKYNSLNVSGGAICSSELKRDLRRKFLTANKYSYNAFGFDLDEVKRVKGMAKNNSEVSPIFPLLMAGLSKKDCIEMIQQANDLFVRISIPRAYKLGFNNNNCLQTGCVQGGVGYWQKMKVDFPDKFEAMAKMEHELTDRKGSPVTMLRNGNKPCFLIKHPGYSEYQDISIMRGRPPKPLTDCNGFCGTNDLEKNETENEINYQL